MLQTEAPLDENFEIGAFTAEPGKAGYQRSSVLRLEHRPLKSGRQEIHLVVDQLPKVVGVDPYNIRIDRDSDDNFAQVERQ